MRTLILSFAAAALLASAASVQTRNQSTQKQKNILYIIVDDQDAGTATPEIMPKTAKWFKDGTNYTNFYSPISICCPSRTSFLTAQYAHNHNVTDVGAPYGGWALFCAQGRNGRWLPKWLQKSGYNTYYTGKLMNGNTVANAVSLAVDGFNVSDILLDPFTYVYNNASYSHNGQPAVQKPGQYSTYTIRDNGLSYIDAAVASGKPFFIGVAPIAPHAETQIGPKGASFLPPVSAPQYAGWFNSTVAPRSASFNPDKASGVSWVANLTQLNQTQVDYYDSWYRNRLRSLQSVDDLVDALLSKLQDHGVLDNTHVIYTSDNGYSIGQHRRRAGKTTGYEEDIRIPLLVRGPGVNQGKSQAVYAVPDLSTSIAHIASAEPDYELDGRVMPWASGDGVSAVQAGKSTHSISEFWNYTVAGEGIYGDGQTVTTGKYRTLRVIEDGQDWAYTVWCTGERELYNMTADVLQMNNLLSSLNSQGQFAPVNAGSSQILRVTSRLDAILLSLKHCKGRDCRVAWPRLFPYGEVSTLAEALAPQYDYYFNRLPKNGFTNCDSGYHILEEYPVWTTDLPYFKANDANATVNAANTKRAWEEFRLVIAD